MEGSDAVGGYGRIMISRGVALVGLPVVGRVIKCERLHNSIPLGLRNDACCGNGEVFAVTFDHALVVDERCLVVQPHDIGGVGRHTDGLKIRVIGVETVAVYNKELWGYSQGANGPVHGEDAGI